MYIQSSKNKDGTRNFEIKYDLTNYSLHLANKDKKEFYFIPNDKKKLNSCRFICDSPESRMLWYKNLQNVMKSDDGDPLSALAISPSFFEPGTDYQRSMTTTAELEGRSRPGSPQLLNGQEATLTDISEYLMKHDATLE